MGITRELVRSVFSKSWSIKTHKINNNAKGKRKSMSTYLHEDEFSSTIPQEVPASVNSSEAIVTQPIYEDSTDKSDIQRKETSNDHSEEQQNLCEAAAAVIIQSAFRGFMVRCRYRATQTASMKELLAGKESASMKSLCSSIEVQAGNSIEVVSIQEDVITVHNQMQHISKPPIFRPKEDWDNSTVDSNISKMRIQNRSEAMTRRDRALAYAFSQQLRICSKKKQTKSDVAEPHFGLSWLERWMATRLPESSTVEDCISKQVENVNRKSRQIVSKKLIDLPFEEKESCGSNEVPATIGKQETTAPEDKVGSEVTKNRLKSTRNIPRRKTVPTYHCPKEHAKTSKKNGSRGETGKRQKVKQMGNYLQ
ncbi:hypothetical protein Nepgr_000569 [Nepenthes gracilis]|uniref:Uncharacterized protein n=1 Tax=Nepenthes gracilis TaxID=150966 RepID=A0AAD3RWW8_NEPGR|nr:hypothetical protein Nepgr_000569 [Nepenthes gracilis]